MLFYTQKINNIHLILKLSLYTAKSWIWVKLCYSLVPILDLDGNKTEIAFFLQQKKMAITDILLNVRQNQDLPIKTALSKVLQKSHCLMSADNFSAGSHIRKLGPSTKAAGSSGRHTSNVNVQSDRTQANYNG